MSILVGRADIYDIDICNKQPTFHYHMTRSITTITADLVQIIKDLCIKVKRPLKKNIKICRSLWTRDQSICVDNQIYFFSNIMPPTSPRHDKAIQTIPYNGKLVKENIIIDGGDIIQDGNIIYVGQSSDRTDKRGLAWVRKTFPKHKVVPIKHKALHLDCCFSVMPNNHLLYSKRYISSLPQFVRKKYICKKVEDLLEKNVDANLATNNLIIGNNIITTNQPKFRGVRSYLKKLGFNVIELKYGTLWRHDGGVRCLTQWIKQPAGQNIF